MPHFFPFRAWPKLDRALFKSEALAGLTVGLVVIPQGVAYAGLAGMPLVTGIYASLLPSLIGALFSASTRLSVGPTALTCLLISASIGGLAEPGGADWVNLAVWLALLSGLFQLVLGALRAGSLLNLVSAPVLMAFTQAAAVLIILSQLGDLVGWPSGNVQGVFSSFDGFEWPVISAAALCFGVGSLVVLLAFRRWQARFPAVLVVMLLAAGISAVVQFQASGGAVVGALPGGLPTFYWPHWPGLSTLQHLLVPALIVTLVSFLETAASARVDSERQGKPWGQNQDLIGQGLAKVASALSGSFATSSSFSRSALNLYAGAQTGWATVFAVIVVFFVLQFFLPLLHQVPLATLAAIVIVSVMGLIRLAPFKTLWAVSRPEAGVALLTFLATLLSAPKIHWGVLVGVVAGLAYFLYQRLKPRIDVLALPDLDGLSVAAIGVALVHSSDVVVLRLEAGVDFASANALEAAVAIQLLAQPNVRYVVLLFQSVNRMDATGVEAFLRIKRLLSQRGDSLVVIGIKPTVERLLRSADALTPDAHFRLCVSSEAFIKSLDQINIKK